MAHRRRDCAPLTKFCERALGHHQVKRGARSVDNNVFGNSHFRGCSSKGFVLKPFFDTRLAERKQRRHFWPFGWPSLVMSFPPLLRRMVDVLSALNDAPAHVHKASSAAPLGPIMVSTQGLSTCNHDSGNC